MPSSSLRYKFSRVHLRFAKFLCQLQMVCHDIDSRLKEPQKGEPAKPRHLTYVANDRRIQQAKEHEAHHIGVGN